MNEYIGLVFISIGLLFNVVASLSLVRFPDLYCRLQASTKCVTLGTCSILFGAAIYVGMGQTALKAILCIVFLFFTTPTVAHEISKAAHVYGIKLWGNSVIDKYETEVDKKVHWGDKLK